MHSSVVDGGVGPLVQPNRVVPVNAKWTATPIQNERRGFIRAEGEGKNLYRQSDRSLSQAERSLFFTIRRRSRNPLFILLFARGTPSASSPSGAGTSPKIRLDCEQRTGATRVGRTNDSTAKKPSRKCTPVFLDPRRTDPPVGTEGALQRHAKRRLRRGQTERSKTAKDVQPGLRTRRRDARPAVLNRECTDQRIPLKPMSSLRRVISLLSLKHPVSCIYKPGRILSS